MQSNVAERVQRHRAGLRAAGTKASADMGA